MRPNFLIFLLILASVTFANAKLRQSQRSRSDQSSNSNWDSTNNGTMSPAKALGAKYRKLEDLSQEAVQGQLVIPLSTKHFHQLILHPPRNYSAIVLFFSRDFVTCPQCKYAISSWTYLTKIYHQQKQTGQLATNTLDVKSDFLPLYFLVVEMDDYKQLKIDVDPSSPNFYYFAKSSTKNLNPFHKLQPEYLGHEKEFDLQVLAKWIQNHTGVFINFRLAQQTEKGSALYFYLGMSSLLLFMIWRHYGFASFYEKILKFDYGFAAVALSLWCVSGQIHNQIRGGGVAYYNRYGEMVFISPNYREQTLTECCFVMGIYGTIVYSIIQLIENKRKEKEEGKKKATTDKMISSGCYFILAFSILCYLVTYKR